MSPVCGSITVEMFVLKAVCFALLFVVSTNCVEIFEVNQKACTCVPYFQCSDETGNVITDGSGLLESRKYTSGYCTGYFDVCCNAVKYDTTEEPLVLNGCGYQNPELSPWSGALFYQQTSLNPPTYKCGISLIHRQVALTAAHCMTEGLLTVHVGSTMKKVTKAIRHPLYNINTLQNDIVLLILESPITSLKSTEILCVPPPGSSLTENKTSCMLTSWNKDIFLEKLNSRLTIQKINIVPREACLEKLRQTRLGSYFQLHRSFLCAGARRNSCGGDGGSPLICPIPGQPNRYHQAGIVSWGIGCGESNIPSVYVNLALFRDWIDNEMMRFGFEINDYRY